MKILVLILAALLPTIQASASTVLTCQSIDVTHTPFYKVSVSQSGAVIENFRVVIQRRTNLGGKRTITNYLRAVGTVGAAHTSLQLVNPDGENGPKVVGSLTAVTIGNGASRGYLNIIGRPSEELTCQR